MQINFESHNLVIIQFPSYAGGKFISNCLSLSKYCVPQDLKLAEYLLKNPANYDYRLAAVLDTLPTRSDMKNWISKYELGDQQLFGSVHLKWREGDSAESDCNKTTNLLSNSYLKFFMVCHPMEQLFGLLKVWPNATIIRLINYNKFRSISHALKQLDPISDGNYCRSKYLELAGPDWPTWQEFESHNFNTNSLVNYSADILNEINQFYKWYQVQNPQILFDIDNSIFDRDHFLTSMNKLYQNLGFDDFDPVLIEKFWQKYIDLHQNI